MPFTSEHIRKLGPGKGQKRPRNRNLPLPRAPKVQFERNNLTDLTGSQQTFDALQAPRACGMLGFLGILSVP